MGPCSASNIIHLPLVCSDACLRSLSSTRAKLILYFWQLVERSFHCVVISFRSPSSWHDGGHFGLSVEIWEGIIAESIGAGCVLQSQPHKHCKYIYPSRERGLPTVLSHSLWGEGRWSLGSNNHAQKGQSECTSETALSRCMSPQTRVSVPEDPPFHSCGLPFTSTQIPFPSIWAPVFTHTDPSFHPHRP